MKVMINVRGAMDVRDFDPPSNQTVYTKPKDWRMEADTPLVDSSECCSHDAKVIDKGLTLRQPL